MSTVAPTGRYTFANARRDLQKFYTEQIFEVELYNNFSTTNAPTSIYSLANEHKDLAEEEKTFFAVLG